MTGTTSDLKKDCPMRCENGDCQICREPCTEVDDPLCKMLHFAYDATQKAVYRVLTNIESVIIGRAIKITPPEWISVEDKTPSSADGVEKFLVAIETASGRVVEMARYINGHLTPLALEAPDGIITHWMKLPEPPKTRNEKE